MKALSYRTLSDSGAMVPRCAAENQAIAGKRATVAQAPVRLAV